jgi:HSP20 family protein
MRTNVWDPFREIEEMADRIRGWSPRSTNLPSTTAKETLTKVDWAPAVDISETTENYVIKAELPAVKKEDIQVTIQDGVITIRGERHQETEHKDERFHRVERSYGSFMRRFNLPDNVDEQHIKAGFKDGVLTLNLNKTTRKSPRAAQVMIE